MSDLIEQKKDITLIIEKEYQTFNEFYSENKCDIFSAFLDLFQIMDKERERNEFVLEVVWKIKKSTITTEYQYDRNSTHLLEEVLLPYFEEIEDYETCQLILKLNENLKNH